MPRIEFAFCLFLPPMMGKLKTTTNIRRARGWKVVAVSVFCCNGTKIDLLSISVGLRLWFRFQSNLWALQVQVNMCDKRPYEARTFFSPKLLNKNVSPFLYFSVYWNLSGADWRRDPERLAQDVVPLSCLSAAEASTICLPRFPFPFRIRIQFWVRWELQTCWVFCGTDAEAADGADTDRQSVIDWTACVMPNVWEDCVEFAMRYAKRILRETYKISQRQEYIPLFP